MVASASFAHAQTPAEALKVNPLVKDGQVLVSFSLNGGLTD